MKLIKLELHNFCQHESREVDFSLGLSGILGHNGAGKSNLIQGLIYAITGTTTNNLESYIRRGSDGDSWVRLTFRSDLTDMTYVLKRGIKPRKAELSCVKVGDHAVEYQGKTIRKSKEIDAYLTDVLHIDFNIVKNVLTVSQEDFVSFFRTTPSARAEILTRLFGFTELKTARESLRQLLIDTKVENEYAPKLKAYRELLATEERSLEPYAQLPDKDAVTKKYQAFEEQFKQMNELLNVYKTIEFFNQQRSTAESNLKAFRERHRLLVEQQKPYQVDAQQEDLYQRDKILSKAHESADLIGSFSGWIPGNMQRYYEAYQDLCTVPEVPDEEYKKTSDQKAVLRQKVEELMQFEATGCCPTCGQPFPNLAEKLAKAREEYHEVKVRYKEMKLNRQAREEKGNTMNIAERDYMHVQSEVKDMIERFIEQYDKPEYPWFSTFLTCIKAMPDYAYRPEINQGLLQWVEQVIEEAKKLETLYQENASALSEYEEKRKQFQAYKAEIDSCILNINLAERTIQELNQRYPLLPFDAPTKAEALKWLEQAGETRTQYQQLLSEIQRAADIKTRINSIKSQIESIELLAKQDEDRATLRESVTEACQVLSPDAFPKYLMIGLLEMLTSNINYYLSAFNAPYTVKIDSSSTELYCEFNNGETFVASELSGGQKMILAISWRLALHNTFATEESCGFLTLDEPTNHLDADNIQNLTNVLAQVKQAAKGSNLQILVITHEAALEPLFDSVIRL